MRFKSVLTATVFLASWQHGNKLYTQSFFKTFKHVKLMAIYTSNIHIIHPQPATFLLEFLDEFK